MKSEKIMSSKRFIKFQEYWKNDDCYFVVMEKCDGGDLKKMIENEKRKKDNSNKEPIINEKYAHGIIR